MDIFERDSLIIEDNLTSNNYHLAFEGEKATYIKATRGKDAIYLEEDTFRLHRIGDGITNFKCSVEKCPAGVMVEDSREDVINNVSTKWHNIHGDSGIVARKQMFRNELERIAKAQKLASNMARQKRRPGGSDGGGHLRGRFTLFWPQCIVSVQSDPVISNHVISKFRYKQVNRPNFAACL